MDFYENNDPYRPWLWVGRVDQFIIALFFRRASISFHHACGLINATSGGFPCQLNLDSVTRVNDSLNESWNNIVEIGEDRLFNGLGAGGHLIQDPDEWNFENLPLPMINEGLRLNLNAKYDINLGAVGLDNIKLHTQQK